MSERKAPVHPFSLGGGGQRFEIQVAISYVISLLKMEFARGLEKGGVVHSVNLQQRNRGNPVDDINVVTKYNENEITLYIQAKHTLRFTDTEDFNEVLNDCWNQFCKTTFKKGTDHVGIVISEVSNSQKIRTHLQDLLKWAETSIDEESFYQKAQLFRAKEEFLRLFEGSLNKIAGRTLTQSEIWMFLKSLVVISFDFDNPGSRDNWDIQNKISSILKDKNPDDAKLVFSALYELTSKYCASGGEIDIGVVTNNLSQISLISPSVVMTELRLISETLTDHLRKQIQKQKNAKRYIPDVFVEVSSIKDKARFFVHPVLFIKKAIEDIQRLNFDATNLLLSKFSHESIYIEYPAELKQAQNIDEARAQSIAFINSLEETKSTVEIMSPSGSSSAMVTIAEEKQYIYDEAKYNLGSCAHKLKRQIEDCIDYLNSIRSSVFFLVAKAGQGKTNFVCDFAENVLIKRSIPCLFFTGRDLNYVSPDKIGEYIIRFVFGDRYNGSLDNMLADLEKLGAANRTPVIIIIDGINEHKDINAFTHHLEGLVERILTYNNIKLIMTCRSEYFDERFGNLRIASFSNYIYFAQDFGRRMSDMHKEHLIEAYFQFFKLKCPYLSEKVEESLKNDTLLLRIFCEAYGDHCATRDIILPQLVDLYKDEIFTLYLSRKLEEASKQSVESSPLAVGRDIKYKLVLQQIIRLMIEKEQFTNIPVSELGEDRNTIAELIGEDIILRIDLAQSGSTLDEKSEVINFTFDEFRDFLLVVYLVHTVFKKDVSEFERIIGRLTMSKLPVSEGVSKFLFLKSKHPETKDIGPVISKCDWYKDVLLQCIFSTKEEFITDNDLEEIKLLFTQNNKNAKWIVFSLLHRWEKDFYPKLNIELLFRIFDDLDDAGYKKIVVPIFEEHEYGWRAERSPIDDIAARIGEILDREGLSRCPSAINLAELLIYLFCINGTSTPFPAFSVFNDFAIKNNNIAVGLLKKHSEMRSKFVALKIRDMLSKLSGH